MANSCLKQMEVARLKAMIAAALPITWFGGWVWIVESLMEKKAFTDRTLLTSYKYLQYVLYVVKNISVNGPVINTVQGIVVMVRQAFMGN